MSTFSRYVMLSAIILLLALAPLPAVAQTEQPAFNPGDLAITTAYPSQVVGMKESTSIDLNVRTGTTPQVVRLQAVDIPDGWTATFRGGGKIISAVYVEPGTDSAVTLKMDPPAGVAAGSYDFLVSAKSDRFDARLPLELTVQEKLPPNLAFEVELPTLMGKPNATLRYSATLSNKGDEDLTVNLTADPPAGFDVTFLLSGQEVTNMPLEANRSKSLDVEVRPYADVQAGSYPITVHAQGDEAEASVALTAEVTGESQLTVSAPDGRLSGQAYAGEGTPLKIIVSNTGSAPAHAIAMSSTEPAGWSVQFDPKQIEEIPAGQQMEVTAMIQPSDKALAGDYVVTVNARPEQNTAKSADFRITVLTSTLWGMVGVALIAIAVGVVALAVLRFGRR